MEIPSLVTTSSQTIDVNQYMQDTNLETYPYRNVLNNEVMQMVDGAIEKYFPETYGLPGVYQQNNYFSNADYIKFKNEFASKVEQVQSDKSSEVEKMLDAVRETYDSTRKQMELISIQHLITKSTWRLGSSFNHMLKGQ